MSTPSLFVDQLLYHRSVIHVRNGLIAVTVSRSRRVGTCAKQSRNIAVKVAVEWRPHIDLLSRHQLQHDVGGFLYAATGLALLGFRILRVPEDGRIQLPDAGPRSGAVVDHHVEEIDGSL